MPERQHWLAEIEQLLHAGRVTASAIKIGLKFPQFRYRGWEIGTERNFKTVVLKWLASSGKIPNPAVGWEVCPPSDLDKHWSYRVRVLPIELKTLLQQIDSLEQNLGDQHSNSYCEIWDNKSWRKIAVQLAITRPDALIRCQECHGSIQLHRAGPSGVPRAHAEHRVRHAGCSLGHYFDGVQRLHPNPVTDGHNDSAGAIVNEEDESAFPEGTAVYKHHRHLERDGALSRRAKAARLESTGKLCCEVCSIDFQETYGALGTGFIEAHHQVPVHQLDGTTKTKISDLALVCSNCHRMLHRSSPPLSVPELRKIIEEHR